MKSFIISFISIGILICGWGIFVHYADNHLHDLMNMIDEEILADANEGDWDSSAESFQELSNKWHDQKKIYSLFLDTEAVNNTDFSIARAKKYIESKDLALSAGELNCIREQLGFLHLNEIISLENII